jgi:hypothetical protein
LTARQRLRGLWSLSCHNCEKAAPKQAIRDCLEEQLALDRQQLIAVAPQVTLTDPDIPRMLTNRDFDSGA